MIDLSKCLKRIVSLETVQAGRLLEISQDESRELITLMTAISVTPDVLSSTLIYQDISRNLQNN